MKTYWMLAAISVLLLAGLGCYSARNKALEAEVQSPGSHIQSKRGQAIAGYTDTTGNYTKFDGRVRLISTDSLEFTRAWERGGPLMRTRPAVRFVLHRSEVKTIFARQINPVTTFIAVIGVTALVGAVAIGVALATKESCPFIYSYDGEQYVFDGEPYGGATMQSLERTDWSELEHLVAVGGAYRVALTNEVDETQHTNSLALVIVDHAPGTAVVVDKRGEPHAFRKLVPLSDARDEHGKDLRRWLRDSDHAAWSPDLEAAARVDSLGDARNHITLSFRRPVGVARAYLVSNVATGIWGSHMIRSMLALRGNRVDDFYAAINGNETYQRQLLEWNEREELYMLHFEVRRGERWVRQDYIPGAGPFISESRAIPVDLDGVIGDRVQIRIHPPIGFWSLNSFHLAWDEDRVRVTRLAPKSAENQDSKDVATSLAANDDAYLDFPTTHDRAQLVFDAPPATPGMTRTIFAETRGWYQLHLHGLGEPDRVAIDHMTREPGYVVRRSLEEFAEYARTGKLVGAAVVPVTGE